MQTNDLYLEEFLVMESNIWKNLIVCKQMHPGSFKNKRRIKHDLALNLTERLICHKTQPNQNKPMTQLWLGVEAPERVLSIGQIDLFDI